MARQVMASITSKRRPVDGDDAVELSVEMRPEVVVLVTGNADFAHLTCLNLALQLRGVGFVWKWIAKFLEAKAAATKATQVSLSGQTDKIPSG